MGLHKTLAVRGWINLLAMLLAGQVQFGRVVALCGSELGCFPRLALLSRVASSGFACGMKDVGSGVMVGSGMVQQVWEGGAEPISGAGGVARH